MIDKHPDTSPPVTSFCMYESLFIVDFLIRKLQDFSTVLCSATPLLKLFCTIT